MTERRIAQRDNKFSRFREADGDIPNLRVVHKFGRITDVGSILTPVCLSKFYRTPSSPQELEIVSTSAQDSAGGTGAWHVFVEGVRDDLIKASEVVTLSGTTPVPLANKYWRIYRWYVLSSGTYASQSTGSHVGNLTIRGLGGGDIWSVINDTSVFSRGQSQIGVYSTAINEKAYISHIHINIESNKTVNLLLFKRTNFNVSSAPYAPMRLIQEYNGLTGIVDFAYDPPISDLPPLTDFGFMINSNIGTADASVDFTIEIEQIEQEIEQGDASLVGVGVNSFASVSASPTLIKPASADIDGSGEMTHSGSATLSASASVIVSASIAAISSVILPASAEIDGSGEMTYTGSVILPASASVTASTSVVAISSVILPASADIDGSGATTANATLAGAVSLPASTEFWLDATDTNSYDNVTDLQTWKNVETTPSSGASQTTYDVNRGTTSSSSTDDPTFTGTAGNSGAYFSYDGGDVFIAKSTNTFIQTLTRSDQTNEWWAACHFRRAQINGNFFITLFAAASSSATEHGGALLYNESTDDLQFWRRNATGNTNAITIDSSAFSLDTDYLVIFGYNSSTGEWSYYKNGKALTASGTNSPPTSTVDGTDKLGIGGADGASGARHPSTARQYQFGMGNTALTSGIVSDIVDYVNQQSGTSYS